jgi:anti-sigma regulatory factor (Ser/Thr protein kinase)
MKKLYTTEKYNKHFQKTAEKKQDRERLKLEKEKRKNQRLQTYIELRKQNQYKDIKIVKKSRDETLVQIFAPSFFSIKGNTETMLSFFEQITLRIRENKEIFLDFKKINKISADAILYLIALMKNHELRHHPMRISGNLPEDELSKQLILESGFFDHVRLIGQKIKSINADVLTIRSDNKTKGSIAKEVVKFAKKKLGKTFAGNQSNSIYKTLIECMENTNGHAYAKLKSYTRWYLIALYNKDKNVVHFTFLDTGFGIPATVAKTGIETFLQKFKKIVKKDSVYIYSTLTGDFQRTRTGKPYRGLGLPSIYSFSQKKMVKNLVVISNYGFVDCNTNKHNNLRSIFRGTLLSWDFV